MGKLIIDLLTMKIFKKWDLWYWIAIILIVLLQSQETINSPEYQWQGLGVFTILLIATIIYGIAKPLQIIFRKKL